MLEARAPAVLISWIVSAQQKRNIAPIRRDKCLRSSFNNKKIKFE